MRITYSRSSTATQSLLRQRHILTEAGLLVRTEGVAEGFRPADGVLLFEDPATSSKIPALERPAFAKVAAAAHPGDVLTVSKLFRLCRDLIDIHAVRDWCQARGVALHVLSGPLSNFHDLAANIKPKRRVTASEEHPSDQPFISPLSLPPYLVCPPVGGRQEITAAPYSRRSNTIPGHSPTEN
ncbi:MAG: pinR, partial [Nonomuraea muscovyensis]|nr:pinR [Nonomuraea muscovyensis]